MSSRRLASGLVLVTVMGLGQVTESTGQAVDAVSTVDVAEARKLFLSGSGGPGTARAPEYLKPTFERYVFEGEVFPKLDYPEPERIRSLVGSYTPFISRVA